MNQSFLTSRRFAVGVIMALCLLYCLLPSANCSGDALCYAADARYGNNLFQPHHLLYTAFNYVLFYGNANALRLMALLNALFAGGSLLVLYLLLAHNRPQSSLFALLGTLLVGASFGFMRFSVESEAYIIPIFWSLLATYCFNRFLSQNVMRWVLLSALFASIAVLFHQIHLFWGMALFIGFFLKNKKSVLLFALVTLIVPVAYMAVVVACNGEECSLSNLWNYLTFFYHSSKGHMSVSTVNLLLTPISMVRTMLQVHGNLLQLFQNFWWIRLVAVLGVLALLYSLRYVRSIRFQKPVLSTEHIFEWTMALAFVLQLFFAFLSDGNAEFMVMLPALFVLACSLFVKSVNVLFPTFIVAGCFLWNMAVAIIPQHVYNYYNPEAVVSFVNQKGNCRFWSADYLTVVNRNYYDTGIDMDPRYIVTSSASLTDSLLMDSIPVYTDAITYPCSFSRATIVFGPGNGWPSNVRCQPVYQFSGAFGNYRIDSLYLANSN